METVNEKNLPGREDSAPPKKKIKSGRISPRAIFGSLDPGNNLNHPALQTTPQKNNSQWKPPIKMSTSCSEPVNFPFSNFISVDPLKNVQASQSADSQKNSLNKIPISINEEQINEDLQDNNLDLSENAEKVDEEISPGAVDQGTQKSNNEQPFEKLDHYLDECIEKELSNDVDEDKIQTTIHSQEKALSDNTTKEKPVTLIAEHFEGVEIVFDEVDKVNSFKRDINNYLNLDLKDSLNSEFSPHGLSQMEKENMSTMFQLKSTLVNEKICSNDELPIIDQTLNTEIKPEFSKINESRDNSQDEERKFSENYKYNTNSELKELNDESDNLYSEKGSSREAPANNEVDIISDPFQGTVSNSQFIRLENEISQAGKNRVFLLDNLRRNEIVEIHQNAQSLGNQIDWQKTILRKMIKDLDELNQAVMKATIALRNPQKGANKHI